MFYKNHPTWVATESICQRYKYSYCPSWARISFIISTVLFISSSILHFGQQYAILVNNVPLWFPWSTFWLFPVSTFSTRGLTALDLSCTAYPLYTEVLKTPRKWLFRLHVCQSCTQFSDYFRETKSHGTSPKKWSESPVQNQRLAFIGSDFRPTRAFPHFPCFATSLSVS